MVPPCEQDGPSLPGLSGTPSPAPGPARAPAVLYTVKRVEAAGVETGIRTLGGRHVLRPGRCPSLDLV